MPTRQQYQEYFESLIGSELNEYSAMSNMQNSYEKLRERNFRPASEASLQERGRMEAMIADMRRQNADKIRIHAKKILASQAKGETPKLPTYDNKEVPVFDISYVLAESLQHLYSSEDPRAEYYDWVEAQRAIEVAINTNGTTEDEIKARNGFISFLDDRETELKLIIMLYTTAERGGTGYYKEMAQNKLSFLNFKLSELRRLRDRTQATKSKSDEREKAEKEFEHGVQKTVGAIAIASAAEGLEQARQNYLKNQGIAKEFDSAMEGVTAHYRPETHSVDEILAKKERLYASSKRIAEVLSSLRMGVSKDEMERQKLEARKNLVRRHIGFNRYAFRQLEQQNETAN